MAEPDSPEEAFQLQQDLKKKGLMIEANSTSNGSRLQECWSVHKWPDSL